MRKLLTKIKDLFKWEYWPAAFFYLPNLPYALYLAIKARNLLFFTAANPGIKSSGNGTESKYKTLQLIPEVYRPKSILINPNTSFNTVLKELEATNMSFPVIAKPDIGFRGLLVQKIESTKELNDYLNKHNIPIIIQEFLDYKYECGIFYHRMPNEDMGKITSITLKLFLSVKGNGKSTLKELILQDIRAKRYINILQQTHKKTLSEIPKRNKIINLSSIGNHAKGTQFINGNHLISKKLEQTFDVLNKSIPGWYYGRMDIKYNDFSDIEAGINFKILEINGIISEPTHIYDASKNSYFSALHDFRTHWKILYNISLINHNYYDVSFSKKSTFVAEIIWLYKLYIKKYKRNFVE